MSLQGGSTLPYPGVAPVIVLNTGKHYRSLDWQWRTELRGSSIRRPCFSIQYVVRRTLRVTPGVLQLLSQSRKDECICILF
jgi:hypothetical protein